MAGYDSSEWMAASLAAGWCWVTAMSVSDESAPSEAAEGVRASDALLPAYREDGAEAMIELGLEYESGRDLEFSIPVWPWPGREPRVPFVGLGR